MKIVGLGGSLRARSFTAAALQAGLAAAQELGADTELLDLRTLNLPMYLPDASIESYPAEAQPAVARLLAACRGADAMLWATPTYHGALSGVFKNAIDFLQMLARDPVPYLHRKAVGLVSVADPAPLANMAGCVTELRAWLAPTRVTLVAEDFCDDLQLTDERARRRLHRLVAELIAFKA